MEYSETGGNETEVRPDIHSEEATRAEVPDGAFARIRRDWIEPVFVAFALAVLIRMFIFQPFRIPSGSMEDTLLIGDQIVALKCVYGIRLPFVDKLVLKFRDPKPGDVVIFKYPADPTKDFIKRCVAVGGQTVRIADKRLYVDGHPAVFPKHGKFLDPAILSRDVCPRDDFGPVTIPAGSVFVLGDNRDNSNDSRFWGFVPLDNIRGKASIIYWSRNVDVPIPRIVNAIRWNRLLRPIR